MTHAHGARTGPGDVGEGAGGARARVACLMEDERLRAEVERLLHLWMPGLEVLAESTPAVRGVPDADAIVLDAPQAGDAALDRLRTVRAAGFGGGVVVVVPRSRAADPPGAGGEVERAADAADSEAGAEWTRLSGRPCLVDDESGERLVELVRQAIVESARPAEPDDSSRAEAAVALAREVAETRRRLAVAGVAMGLQHALNNPLAALLAEAQLLEMEQLPAEQRAAVRRMVELCRRMGTTLRALDVAREEERPAPSPRPATPSSVAATVEALGGGSWFVR